MSAFSIFLVSLENDIERRNILSERFKEQYNNFIHLKAVDGRTLSAKEYFLSIQAFFKKYKRLMSPAELGCTLSHIQVLKEFLESDAERALIIEDDVIGCDQDIEKIQSLASSLSENSLLICGGQVGLSDRYLFGRVDPLIGCYKVAEFSYPYIYGTCCYVVTRKSAQAILDYQLSGITLADKWDVFFQKNDICINYLNVLAHPIDMANSHIESDRVLNRVGFFRKLFSFDIGAKALRFIKRESCILLYRLLPGWVKLP